MHTPLPYTQDATVFMRSSGTLETAWLRLLADCPFRAVLTRAWQQTGKAKPDFTIILKTDVADGGRPATGVDPGLINGLLYELTQAGFTNVIVATADDELVLHDFASVLGQRYLSRTWADADFRISFAKNRTHRSCFYAGCLLNVLPVLSDKPAPEQPRHKTRFYEACGLLLTHFPVHFGFVDAWTSQSGAGELDTQTLLASANVFALDWVLGEKMELDPARNFVMQEALLRWGPVHIIRNGNTTPWTNWRNVRPMRVLFTDLAGRWPHP